VVSARSSLSRAYLVQLPFFYNACAWNDNFAVLSSAGGLAARNYEAWNFLNSVLQIRAAACSSRQESQSRTAQQNKHLRFKLIQKKTNCLFFKF
jgi:hypothetical protein